VARKQMTGWIFFWYWDMYFYKLELACRRIFLKEILFDFWGIYSILLPLTVYVLFYLQNESQKSYIYINITIFKF
jgi:hypothetical protein